MDNVSIFYFQYPAPKNAYYPPAAITHQLGYSRAARVAKLLQTVFWQVGIIFVAGY
jgi:hypothetical protein